MTPEAAKKWAQRAGLALRYDADLARLAACEAPFVQLDVDEQTARYIENSEAARHGRFKTWLHRRLRWFLSDFDINGLLGTYPMHVLSEAQWTALIEPIRGVERNRGQLLDVGAGRGDATEKLAALFESTVVTETSAPMAKRLSRLGYECWNEDITDSTSIAHRFDAVSLLNVLDRCENPMSLLGTARSALAPDGLLIIALVLPYRPFVYDHGTPRSPRQRLPISSESWEIAASEFITMSLIPLGLEIKAISRAPYLSGGDAAAPLYELDDLIVICRAHSAIPMIGA